MNKQITEAEFNAAVADIKALQGLPSVHKAKRDGMNITQFYSTKHGISVWRMSEAGVNVSYWA